MRFKRMLTATTLVALLAGMMTVTASPAFALSSTESQFVSSHNSIRAQHGRRSLSVQNDLVSVARRHSGRMAAQGSIWHNPNLGSEVSGWSIVGENVGMGPGVSDLMDAFMDSPAHRANIVDPEYNQFGVGVVVTDGTIFVTVVFAKRGASTGTVARPVSKPKRSSTRPTAAKPAVRKPVARPAPAAAAAPKPAPPAPAAPPVRTVSMLVRMISIDTY